MNGAGLICAVLQALGVRHVFGLPGTQNTLLYEELRQSGLRSVVASDEGAAAFMASGYARAIGTVGVLTTIPGPGFLYALAGVAEAHHDSAALLWITLRQHDSGEAFQLQRIDQATMAAPVVKRCIFIERAADLEPGLRTAYAEALAGEPGPVLVEVAAELLNEPSVLGAPAPAGALAGAELAGAELLGAELERLIARLRSSGRPLIFAGQGAQGAADQVRALAHRLRAPVLFTCSGRGVLPDTDPQAFVKDLSFGPGPVVPELIERADLVLVLGCKFTHNGSSGGRLRLAREKLIRVDTASEVLAANYPADPAICARVEDVLPQIAAAALAPSGWNDHELQAFRARLTAENEIPIEHEPLLADCARAPVREFFRALAGAIGPAVVYTADAGLHQALVRRYALVTQARGLLCPSDFQSMGFGLPGAIGAALARPDARVIACIGDGGLALSAGELLTAVREDLDLVIVVFNDESYGLIRRHQLMNFGHAAGVALHNPDFARLAEAIGCSYFPVRGDLDAVARQIAATSGVRLVELRLNDVPSLRFQQAKSAVRERVRAALPDAVWRTLKRLRGS